MNKGINTFPRKETDIPQEVKVVRAESGIVKLNMEGARDRMFRILPDGGADADFTVKFSDIPQNGGYAMLEIVRSTNVERFITFPTGANMVNSDQNLDNGATPMSVGGTDAASGKVRYHYIGIYFARPQNKGQKYIINMQSSRSFVP
jgi:hypothetical protein